jgi:hypothetical protein
MILVGIDPGKVTGVAVWHDPTVFNTSRYGELDVAEVEDSEAVVPVLRRMLDGRRPTLVAIERFVQTGRRMTFQPHAQQVVGAVRSFCFEERVPLVFQQPGPAKKIAPNATLRRLGWLNTSPDQHANDATRHVLLVMATHHVAVYARVVGI